MTTKDEVRARYPEMAAIVDQVRATGGTVTAAWVEDGDGIVLAGRRPEGEYKWAEVDHWPADVQAAVMRPEREVKPKSRGRAVPIRGGGRGR
jgi:hypothetical protein